MSSTEASEKDPSSEAEGPVDPAERLLADHAEMLLRQQNPKFVKEGKPTSEVFTPGSSDEGLLSVSRGSLVSAPESHARHLSKGLQSAAVFGVTVGEVIAIELQAMADPVIEPFPDPAHAVIDFRPLTRGARERAGKKLRDRALVRGALFPAKADPQAA